MLKAKWKLSSLLLAVVLAVSLAGCVNTSYESGIHVAEASVLKTLAADPAVVVIDARSPEDYAKGHLQGAVNLPPAKLTVSTPVEGSIAPKAQVESVMGQLGIGRDSQLYIYDNNGGVNASRIWWVLSAYGHERVHVINNGETAVVATGLPLTTEVPARQATSYTADELHGDMVADLATVKAASEGVSGAKLLDVRTQAEYDEGAIPGAILYPHIKNLYKDGTFRSARDIYLDYTDLGLDRDDEIIVYCKTSFRAAQTALLLKEAGYTHVKVYDGAWTEWSQAGLPVTGAPTDMAAPTAQDAS